jgi:hypothetical protein
MSNFNKGTIIQDNEGTGITAIVQSKKNSKTKDYMVLLTKPGYVDTMIRQKSLPKSPKAQANVAKKWENEITKSGLKSKKCNKGVDYIVHGTKHSFRVSAKTRKSPKLKVFINPTTGRKFTITTIKTRKSPKSKKRKRGGRKRRKRRRRRTKKKV